MKLLSLIFSLIALSGVLVCGEDEPKVELSPEMQRAVKYHKDTCAKAREDYLEAVKKSQDLLRGRIEREIKNVTRRGDLEEALALKAELERLEQETAPIDILGNPIEKLVEVPAKGLFIINATYGAGENIVDVTEHVRKMVKNNTLEVTAHHSSFNIDDPAHKQTKSMTIEYSLDGEKKSVHAKEKVVIKIK